MELQKKQKQFNKLRLQFNLVYAINQLIGSLKRLQRALNMNKYWLNGLLLMALTGCAHQSTITPSQGHIGSGQEAQTAAAAPGSDIPKPVKKPAYVPPPKSKAKEQTYSVVVNDVPVREILFALARESKVNIDIHPAIQGNVTLNAVDQTLPAILDRLSKQVDLMYTIEGNVLSIKPDQPVLRTYKVDYVNMSRDTKGSIGVVGEIAATGTKTSTRASGGSDTNGSRTLVSTEATNHFWSTLIQNIKDILAETDKEIIVMHKDASEQASSQLNATSSDASKPVTNAVKQQDGQKTLTEYKMLYAATVIANPETGVISVRATNKQHERVQEFLDKVMASANRQVLIEATIVEVKLSDDYQAGVDWKVLNSEGFSFTQTMGGAAAASGNQFVAGYINTASSIGSIAASVRLLEKFGQVKVASSPKLMVLNNQTAIMKVVNNYVYFLVESETTQGTTAGALPLTNFTTTPQTIPLGLVMSVTPQISQNSQVILNVRPTITRLTGTKQDPNPNLIISSTSLGITSNTQLANEVPETQISEMESMLKVNSGNIAILGGLMQDDSTDTSDKIPGASKVPFFGKLFGSQAKTRTKVELVIFLRPTVIANASLESEELNKFKQFLPENYVAEPVTTDESAY